MPAFRVQPLTLSQIRAANDAANSTISGVKTFSTTPKFSALTQGSIPFIGSGGQVSQDNAALFWDDTNDFLGVGTSSPSAKIEARTTGANSQIAFGMAVDQGFIYATTGSARFSYGAKITGGTGIARQTASVQYIQETTQHRWTIDSGLTIGNSFVATDRMNLTTTGLGVNVTPAQRFDVKDPNTQMHFGTGTTQGYMGANGTIGTHHGWRFIHNGTNYVAKAASCSGQVMGSTSITWFMDSGLTADATFTPTVKLTLSSSLLDSGVPVRPKSYTPGTLPAASVGGGAIARCTGTVRGDRLVVSDGTNWKYCEDETTTVS